MAKRSSLRNVIRLIDSVQKQLPPEEDFLNDLKRSIEITDEKNWGLPSKTYKPSGMNCIRASYYQVSGIEPDKGNSSYTLVGICNSGSDIHVRIQTAIEQMKENGMDCEYIDVADFVRQRELDNIVVRSKSGMETKLYDKEYNMSFMCDGIIRYKGKYYILELKTESSFKFVSRKEVDESHHKQATAYSFALELDDVLFIYINRDVLDMKAFMFHVTDDMRQDLVAYIVECDSYVKNQIPPPKPEDVARKTCNYCSYKTQCKKDG